MSEKTAERTAATTKQQAALVFSGWLTLDEVDRQDIVAKMEAYQVSDNSGKEEIKNSYVENLKTGPTPSACPCCGR